MKNLKLQKRIRAHKKIRSRIAGTGEVPRLAVFRSNQFIYAQLIDDVAGKTLAAACDLKSSEKSKIERAKKVGSDIADLAKKANINKVVFDRGGFGYKGRVAALAEGARSGGLTF